MAERVQGIYIEAKSIVVSEEHFDLMRSAISENERLLNDLRLAEEGLASYALEVERMKEALERIKQVRHGLEMNVDDEERANYWSALAMEYRKIAADALRGVEHPKTD